MVYRVLNTSLMKTVFSIQNRSNSFETTPYIEMFNSNNNEYNHGVVSKYYLLVRFDKSW